VNIQRRDRARCPLTGLVMVGLIGPFVDVLSLRTIGIVGYRSSSD
jgi:hypothetical protein